MLDIFYFDESGKPVFGDPLFVERMDGTRDIRKFREIFNYSADVSMTINDDREFNAIVIDHLMEVKSRIPGYDKKTWVPDGTYSSYILKKGEWIYNDMLFDPTNNTPLDKDVQSEETETLEKPKSDLFGNGGQ